MLLKSLRKYRFSIVVSLLGLLFVVGGIYVYRDQTSTIIGSPSPVPTSTDIGISTSTASSTTMSSTSTPIKRPPIVVGSTGAVGHAAGMAVGSQLYGLSDDALNKEIAGIAATGATWVRFDVEWGHVQYSSPNTFDWSVYDRIANAITAHNLKALGIITYTPMWARAPDCGGGAHCPPQDPATYATFAAEVAAHYAPMGLHYWEIWNEENDYDFWATKSDCVAYTATLKAAYTAIKKADPNAFVITGGLAQVGTTNVNIAPLTFLQCIYTQGGKGYFDAVADHPYTFPALPSSNSTNAWAQMSLTSPSVRSIMVANGDANKKVWMTEFGVPTNGPDPNWYVSEASQTIMVADTFQLYKTYSWAGPLFWYSYIDGWTATSSNENFFGLVRYDGSTKPAYSMFQSMVAGL